jgi:hypothetical protein
VQRRFHLLFLVVLLIGLAMSAIRWRIARKQEKFALHTLSSLSQPDFAAEAAAITTSSTITPELLTYLEGPFCSGGLCRSGSWTEWAIVAPDSVWKVEELQLLHTALTTTIGALDEKGLDGRALLSGYRFRRSQGTYLPGKLGQVALVQHDTREIRLSDRALHTQSGFHIYHELGHVVDRRLQQALTREFQRLTLGEEGIDSRKTAGGFWLDQFARDRPEEATADAFALWIILNHTTGPEPVFWMKPDEANYDTIAAVMDRILSRITGS